MKSRKAVSPILAVIILVGITLVGGAVLSSFPAQLIIPTFSKLDYQISDFKLEKDAKGSCYFSFSLVNSGTEVLKSVHTKTTLDNGEEWIRPIGNLKNGLSPSNSINEFDVIPLSDPVCGNLTSAKTYGFSINASSNDSSHNILTTVTIQNVTLR